jgi:hypothetical protein
LYKEIASPVGSNVIDVDWGWILGQDQDTSDTSEPVIKALYMLEEEGFDPEFNSLSEYSVQQDFRKPVA